MSLKFLFSKTGLILAIIIGIIGFHTLLQIQHCEATGSTRGTINLFGCVDPLAVIPMIPGVELSFGDYLNAKSVIANMIFYYLLGWLIDLAIRSHRLKANKTQNKTPST